VILYQDPSHPAPIHRSPCSRSPRYDQIWSCTILANTKVCLFTQTAPLFGGLGILFDAYALLLEVRGLLSAPLAPSIALISYSYPSTLHSLTQPIPMSSFCQYTLNICPFFFFGFLILMKNLCLTGSGAVHAARSFGGYTLLSLRRVIQEHLV
jgi:hypothetical protein